MRSWTCIVLFQTFLFFFTAFILYMRLLTSNERRCRAVEGILQELSQFHQHAFLRKKQVNGSGEINQSKPITRACCCRAPGEVESLHKYPSVETCFGGQAFAILQGQCFCNENLGYWSPFVKKKDQGVCSNYRGLPCSLMGRCSGVWYG